MFPQKKNSVEQVFQDIQALVPEFKCVAIMAISKDGDPYLFASSMNHVERQYMAAFMDAHAKSTFEFSPIK